MVQQLRICLPMQVQFLVGELTSDILQLLSLEKLNKDPAQHRKERKKKER